jgi:hypothetical protein
MKLSYRGSFTFSMMTVSRQQNTEGGINLHTFTRCTSGYEIPQISCVFFSCDVMGLDKNTSVQNRLITF